ncbi:cation:proton antiporter [Sphingobacterium yanglingense]|uniref:Transporter (CPA2 family) n=1 Tax=Sphingobacterium yanglingense TaxID=1437280 RepID=A0A4R6WI24_9SPHI|nr:cation:proton antiporter [Sphingobacterium yanglingense]TDQ79873.1 transporter (CPA2 family) [Sphingobacterium yanglingense]
MSSKIFEHLADAFEAPLTNPVLVFSLVLFIILLSPILLRPIRVPGIIGLILSGVIIGPHGLNWLEKSSAVNLFSTIGLLYIMFIAGLELDMNEFKKTKHKSVLFGFFTFAIPIAIGFPVCHYLLGYDVLPSILIASMFATHTLVSYPIVNRYGISKHEAVAITIGGTILTDTAVLIILAVITGASQGNINQEFWVTLGVSFAIFLFIMFGIIPKIAKWFFERIESEKTGHYIFVLTVVFFAAFLAEMAGLEPIIGAFVAGLALNKLIPHSSALMNRIEFIGNAIFIPFFLISVGMIVDVSVLTKGPMALIVAGTLTVVAISGKYLAATVTQLIFKYSKNQRNLIFGLSNAHAAATLAVIMVGYSNDIIDENVLNGTILLILVTCIVATMVTESASKKVVMEGHQDDAHVEHVEEGEEQIMIPIANLSTMEPILDFATLIKSKKSHYPLSILSVVPDNERAERNLIEARRNLDNMAKYASGAETEVELVTTIDYNIAAGISRMSRHVFADCIIMGWPSAVSFVEKIVGEKTESILNSTDTTLFMCRLEKPLISHKSITVFAPPLAESEFGFTYWMEKILKLAQELSLPVNFICNSRTVSATEEVQKLLKSSVPLHFSNYEDWDNIYGLATFSNVDSLLVFVSSRNGEVSYRDSLDGLARRVGRYYKNQNLILLFPSRQADSHIDEYEHIQTAPIFRKISREIGNMFNKEKQN